MDDSKMPDYFERKYHPGYSEAINSVNGMDEKQLIEHIDALYGRERLHYGCTLDEIRAEALRQTQMDFLNQAHPDYRFNLKNLQNS